MKFGAALIVAISMFGASASVAGAADRIYWGNYNTPNTGISAANLDGSGEGRDLFTVGAPRGGSSGAAYGLALDPAAGWLFWTNGSGQLTRGSIDSCDPAAICASNLYPPPAGPPTAVYGPAVDAEHGLIYWMKADGTLRRASLDGSGAVNNTISTTGASPLDPNGGAGGFAIDRRTNRIYWSSDNFGNPGKISWASLDGSGGGDLNTTGANVGRPWGIALDIPNNRAYWSNYNGSVGGKGSVSWASLDGSGGGDLYTSGNCATLNAPNGIAIDHAANKIYWGNFLGGTINVAKLDGTGGCANLSTAGATVSGPDEVALLKAPVATAAPVVSGGDTGVATCAGAWDSGAPEAGFYRAPRTFAYQWRKGAEVVAGATGGTLTPTSSGAYSCTVVASNSAGSSAEQASAPAFVKRLVGFSKPKFKSRRKSGKLALTGKISPNVKPAVSKSDCSGTVKLKFALKKKTIATKSFKLKYKSKKCSAAVALKLAKKYSGKKTKLTISIAKSTKLAATPKTVSLKL